MTRQQLSIAITGSTGLIGTALTGSLQSRGHRVTRVVRSTNPAAGDIGWDPSAGLLDARALTGIDVVVNLAGPSIGGRRWNDRYRRQLVDDRVNASKLLADTIAAHDDRPAAVISASAIGYYGNRGDEVLTEASPPGTGFLPDLCVAWERSLDPARAAGVRVVTLRTGIVLARRGGVLAKTLPLFKLGMGGRFGDGHQYMPWISLTDEIRAISFLIEGSLDGAFNLTAPQPVRNIEFTAALGQVLHRPTMLTVPTFAPRLLLGADMAQALLFDSARVIPEALANAGFEFTHHDVRSALAHEIFDDFDTS